MSKDLKKRGWSFVGPTTVYAFMQAMGLVNDHLEGCHVRDLAARHRGRARLPRRHSWKRKDSIMTELQTLAPHAQDLGGGFMVRRLLPPADRRSVGPFVFFDHFGPIDVDPGSNHDVRPHPHIGLATRDLSVRGRDACTATRPAWCSASSPARSTG